MSKSPEPAAPDQIPVVNREDRLESIAYNVKGEATSRRVVFPPGLSLVDAERAKACGLGSDSDPFQGGGALAVFDPRQAPEHAAIEVARKTGNRAALRAWLGREVRPAVKAAIEARLAGKPTDAEAA